MKRKQKCNIFLGSYCSYSTSVLLHVQVIENIIVCSLLAALPETNNCTLHINRSNIHLGMQAADFPHAVPILFQHTFFIAHYKDLWSCCKKICLILKRK